MAPRRVFSTIVLLPFLLQPVFGQKKSVVRLPAQFVDWVLNDACSVGCTKAERDEYKANLRWELHDLDRDKRAEWFVYLDHSDWCGAGFNCQFWVFQRRGSRYRLLAQAEVIRAANSITNGYRDLESQGRLAGCPLPDGSWGREIYLTVFKYNGAEYRPTVIGEQCRKP